MPEIDRSHLALQINKKKKNGRVELEAIKTRF